MRRTTLRAAVIGGALAGAGLLFATAAAAATFTVTAGNAPTNTVLTVTGTSQGSVKFTDTTTNVAITCTSSTVKGTVTVGSSGGSPIGTITGTTAVFNNCTGPFGLVFNVTGYGNTPATVWKLNAVSYNSTSGVTTGTITNIVAHLETPAGATPACSFDVGSNSSTTFASSGTTLAQKTASTPGGQIGGTYTNSTQILKTTVTSPGTLGLWNVKPFATTHNCVSNSVLKQGDLGTFDGSYKLVATATSTATNPNPIKVVSP